MTATIDEFKIFKWNFKISHLRLKASILLHKWIIKIFRRLGKMNKLIQWTHLKFNRKIQAKLK